MLVRRIKGFWTVNRKKWGDMSKEEKLALRTHLNYKKHEHRET